MADSMRQVIPAEFRVAPGSDTDLHRAIGKAYLRFLKRNQNADLDATDRFVVATATALDNIMAFTPPEWTPDQFADAIARVALVIGQGLHRQHGEAS
jgi:hypothetical protein